jgi:hypothetical protein
MYASPLDDLIESLVTAIQADAAALRERHVLRQTLHALVRQAQAEQAALSWPGNDGFWHKAPQRSGRYQ